MICPVCNWPNADDDLLNFEICSCCGTHFCVDDYERTHAELRADWVAAGMPWFSRACEMPAGWDAKAQLANAVIPEKTS